MKRIMVDIRTKKAAKEAGLKTEWGWLRQYPCLVPKRDAEGVLVKGERYFSKDETEETIWLQPPLRATAHCAACP